MNVGFNGRYESVVVIGHCAESERRVVDGSGTGNNVAAGCTKTVQMIVCFFVCFFLYVLS